MSVTPILQKPQLPLKPRPIVLIGAGGIVKDAHLPAYRKASFPVVSICDLQIDKAQRLAAEYGIENTYSDFRQAIANAPDGAVFDIALPPQVLSPILDAIPEASFVLIQKPLGRDLSEALELCKLCHRKRLSAAVNFQLRWAPFVIGARNLIEQGVIGAVHDIEVRVVANTPWQLWAFMFEAPRTEILYHSIHYIDLIRSFWGDPMRIQAKTVTHPRTRKIASTRTVMALDYGNFNRATITTNHGHDYGSRHQESYIKWEGEAGAIKAQMGLLIDYPNGVPDWFEFCTVEGDKAPEWRPVPIEGAWFPDAFIGSMADVMCVAEGSKRSLSVPVEDACRTMAVVEAAYQSSGCGGIEIPTTTECSLRSE